MRTAVPSRLPLFRRWLSGSVVLLISVAVLASSQASAQTRYLRAPELPAARDTLVGVNYFAGWWKEPPNKWQDRFDGHDWRADYPGRVPLLGEYNTQDVIDREIVAAAEHGVDFFAVLWYPDVAGAGGQRAVVARLNRGVECFLQSPHAHRMRFFIEFCNHPPFAVASDEEWNACIDVWVRAMRHPSYLRVGGRLVFKVHGAGQFFKDSGGDVAKCRARLDVLRDRVRDAGLGRMVIAGGNMGGVGPKHWGARVFDFSCDYMSIADVEPVETDYPYQQQALHVAALRAPRRNDAIPYMPFLCAGWNPRPWKDPRPAFTLPTRPEWKRELERMAEDLEAFPSLGIPLPDGSRQKAFTIYCWNEFGEGGMVAPTRAEGTMKLECIREVFGLKEPMGRDSSRGQTDGEPNARPST